MGPFGGGHGVLPAGLSMGTEEEGSWSLTGPPAAKRLRGGRGQGTEGVKVDGEDGAPQGSANGSDSDATEPLVQQQGTTPETGFRVSRTHGSKRSRPGLHSRSSNASSEGTVPIASEDQLEELAADLSNVDAEDRDVDFGVYFPQGSEGLTRSWSSHSHHLVEAHRATEASTGVALPVESSFIHSGSGWPGLPLSQSTSVGAGSEAGGAHLPLRTVADEGRFMDVESHPQVVSLSQESGFGP